MEKQTPEGLNLKTNCLIDSNGMSICHGLFRVKRFGNCAHFILRGFTHSCTILSIPIKYK